MTQNFAAFQPQQPQQPQLPVPSSNLQAQIGIPPSLQPPSSQTAVLNNQFMSGTMQGQLYNSGGLFVHPQAAQEPVNVTPTKPLISSGKTTSGLLPGSSPLQPVTKVFRGIVSSFFFVHHNDMGIIIVTATRVFDNIRAISCIGSFIISCRLVLT